MKGHFSLENHFLGKNKGKDALADKLTAEYGTGYGQRNLRLLLKSFIWNR